MCVIKIGLNKDLHDPYADILFALRSHHHKASAYGQEFFSAFELDQQSFQLNTGRQQASLRGSTDGIASLPIYRRSVLSEYMISKFQYDLELSPR